MITDRFCSGINPAVSIVLPTYNRAALLGRAIRSVLRQSYTDFELLVIDDGSTDQSANVVGSGWWVPDASVEHWIPKERQSVKYLRSYYQLQGKTFQKSDGDGRTTFRGRPLWLRLSILKAELSYSRARLSRDLIGGSNISSRPRCSAVQPADSTQHAFRFHPAEIDCKAANRPSNMIDFARDLY